MWKAEDCVIIPDTLLSSYYLHVVIAGCERPQSAALNCDNAKERHGLVTQVILCVARTHTL